MTVKEVGFMPTAILWLSFEQSCKPIEVYETFYCTCIYFQWYMQVFLSDALQTQQKKMLTCSSDAISVELFPPRNIAPYVHHSTEQYIESCNMYRGSDPTLSLLPV